MSEETVPSSPMPPTLNHIIGQQRVVEQAQIALDSSMQDNQSFPATLLLGPPGVGAVDGTSTSLSEADLATTLTAVDSAEGVGLIRSVDGSDCGLVFHQCSRSHPPRAAT